MKNRKVSSNIVRQECDDKIRSLFRRFNRVRKNLNNVDESEKILSLAELDLLSKDIKELLLVKEILDNAPNREVAKIALNEIKDEIKNVDVVKPILRRANNHRKYEDDEKKEEVHELIIKAKQKTSRVLSTMDLEIDKEIGY